MRKFSAIKSAVFTKVKSFFTLSTLKSPIALYKIFLFLLFGYLFIKVPFALPNLLIPFYFLTALAGLRLYRIQKYKVYFLAQLGFLFISAYLLFYGPISSLKETFGTLMVSVHSILFLAAYSFFIFFIVFTIFNSIKSPKTQRNIFIIFQVLFWVSCELLLFRDSFDSTFLIFSSFVTAAFFSSLISYFYIFYKESKKRFLVFFQCAFFSTLAFLSFSDYTTQFGLNKDYFPFYVTALYAISGISILWVGFDLLFITYWRRKLVEAPSSSETGKPLSIYPDASLYVDIQGKAEWTEKFIRSSDGAVIGLTGLRGAGKSALLNKIIKNFDKEFFTLHITSPIQSSNRMEFFMMVCREVCSRVMAEIEDKIFRFKKTVSKKAYEALSTSIRVILVLLIIGGAIYYVVSSNMGDFSIGSKTSLSSISLQNNDNFLFRNYDNPSELLKYADYSCVETVLNEINAFITQDKSKFDSIIISPFAKRKFLHILPSVKGIINVKSNYEIFMKNYQWLSNEEISGLRIDSTSIKNLNKNTLFKNTKLNEDVFETIYFTQMIRPIFYELVSQFQAIDPSYTREELKYTMFLSIKEHTLGAFDASLDEAQVNHFSNAVAKMFSISGNFEGSPKLMSWVLLEAFFTHHRNGDILVLDREKVLVLRDLLTAYLGCFTQFNQSTNSQGLINLANPRDYRGLWVLGALLLLILFGGFFYNWFSFFMAGVVNFRAFGLWRESRDFLTLLSYTESKEKGGTFTLSKLFNFSLKRQLTERNLTLPSLTNKYIDYIKKVAELFNKKMIICIDELDKIDDPEDVKHILREIKGALFVQYSYYLISVSEDAAYSFQNRLSSGRDIFESTFDELLTLQRLDSEQAWEMIERRLQHEEDSNGDTAKKPNKSSHRKRVNKKIVEKNKANATAITLYAGGIPREIIRNLREVMLVFEQFEKATPQEICVLLLQKKVQELINGVGNIPITGEKSMSLYGMLKEIKLLLANSDDITTGKVEEIINLIEKCLDVIDPNKFYLSVSISSDEKDKTNYDAIKEDVTDYIELLVMLQVLKDLAKDGRFDPQVEKKVFACYNTLYKNPALAKHILDE